MKKLTLCLALLAFSLASALQAGDDAGCCKSKQAAGTCPAGKQVAADTAKSCCPSSGAKAKTEAKAKAKTDTSAKGASHLVKK